VEGVREDVVGEAHGDVVLILFIPHSRRHVKLDAIFPATVAAL
jgi:hypothetical protein